MKSSSLLTAAIVLLTAGEVFAGVAKTDRFVQKWDPPIDTLVIENPIGNVEVYGSDERVITATVTKTITAVDEKALEEGRKLTAMLAGGNANVRLLKVALPPIRNPRWAANVTWVVRAPRFLHVTVISNTAETLKVANFRGNVRVKNFSGNVILSNVGATVVESVNGNIVYDAGKPFANAKLTSINGDIEVTVEPDANLRWVADTIKGDYRTTMPVRGNITGTVLRTNVNAPGGPTIETLSMMGQLFLLRKNTAAAQARSVRTMRDAVSTVQAASRAEATRHHIVQGRFEYQTSLGNVAVNEIRGDAVVHTGAGEVNIGSVTGSCDVTSGGGPLTFGDVFGPIAASTRAGDITVDAARDGGSLTTEGGTIRLMYNGGAVRLYSGGGDIIARQAAGAVVAEARSGDIVITVDPESVRETIEAKTAKGHITLQVPRKFKADVDATVITNDPGHTIRCDIPGLTIRREQVGGRTRIHATGKINGGGERVQLHAEDGSIVIGSRATSGAAPRR